ncbi:lysophospholipid acyltransferase family protein [Rufibacter quisquiliarum]|uniref:1-acyl-sn-glycerol-3-phosphate acyltransferase n=1 Tax=Rufibacter quisquiliarum TaxID=1549639 RepID=A0A839GCJ7_9BACT|nr:lysophospholipid acyltransferase family protein [Rufibacter quisquiliarum]MBA9076642.1 1-acyl-sn-glycerol-3-phosphate acyltransferase [Rufibacter quisquiliarum]
MLYFLLRVLLTAASRIYFRRIAVQNKQLLPDKGPVIVVSNHPNTFMDPVITASLMKQNIYFLAKSSFFKPGWQAWLFHRLFMIPVYRREDVGGNVKAQNDATFAKCYEFLSGGGTLMVFPEGNSFMQRRLRPIKTGTARIGLGAEAQHGFNLGVRIVPVGINYEEGSRFRSEVFVKVGEPIVLKSFQEAYEQDAFKAAQTLTDLLKERMEELVIHTETDEEDALAAQVEAVYQKTLVDELDLAPTEPEEKFLVTKGIVQSIQYFEARQPERVHQLRTELNDYLQHLKSIGLQPEALKATPKTSRVAWGTVQTLVYLVLGLPVYLFGLVHNYLPYILPAKIARALTKDIEFHAPMMMSIGIFTFPLFYALVGWGGHHWWGLSGWELVAYLVALPLTGFFVLHYWHRIQVARRHWIFFTLFYKRSVVLQHLLAQRQKLMADLEGARGEFMASFSENGPKIGPV